MHRLIHQSLLSALALLAAGMGSGLVAGDDVFVDRFEVGVTGVLVDGVQRYFRRGGGIVVAVECDVVHQVTVEATVTGEDWAFAYDPQPEGFEPTADGFTYTPVCDDAPVFTELTASNPALADFQDVLELVFTALPRSPELLGLAYDYPTSITLSGRRQLKWPVGEWF